MSIRRFDEAELGSWVDQLIGCREVIGVKAKGGRFVFGPLISAAELRLDYDVTILPPKKYLLPQTETLLTFDTEAGYSSVVDQERRVLLGVHPYDVVAISQMDAIFERDHADVHYLSRRRNTVIVATDIQTQSAEGFSACMGTAVVRDGFDVLLSKVGDLYVVEARTDAGEDLLAGMDAPPADDVALARREQLWEDNRRLLSAHRLRCKPEELPAILEAGYENRFWEERSAKCFSCGSCNLVCPTCYCFNVEDDTDWNLTSGTRVRQWDGCMLASFSLVAGGHNFRGSKVARYRHRYYRKGKYLWDRMRQIACVGCGRCTTACTAKIANPVEVYNALQEER